MDGSLMAKSSAKNNATASAIGFEAELWRAADALRSNMDAAEYKHVVLELLFLKYISDAFEEQHAKLDAEPFAEKMAALATTWRTQQAEAARLDAAIAANLERWGYGLPE